MIKVQVSSERNYDIEIGIQWREELAAIAKRFDKVLIVAPRDIISLFAISHFVETHSDVSLHEVEDGEGQKTISSLDRLWGDLAKNQFGRKDAIVAIGGGATSDLAGFAAATWLRGIEWFVFPTTLAAAVDASIGGKTGINSNAGKNLIGAFHSPSGVYIDVSFLNTLTDRDFAAGLAEIIKTGFIASKQILQILHDCQSIVKTRTQVEELIALSAVVKARVVSTDFKEGKLREILNYGHTLGHAIEKCENFTWRHGEAVSVGLVFAAELSQDLLGLDRKIVSEHRELLTKFGLPITYPGDRWDQLADFMRLDKKVRSGRLRFIGLADVASPQWIEEVQVEHLAKIYERISI